MLGLLDHDQKKAVTTDSQYTLVLAGAGAGKSRSLVGRTWYLIAQLGVSPEAIMTVTFTNKAAGELAGRLKESGINTKGIWVGTFHSICVRILRHFGQAMGLKTNFSIYDADDSKKLLTAVAKGQGLFGKDITRISQSISRWKNELQTPKMISDKWMADSKGYWEDAVKCYTDYQSALRKNNALDFDDLILYTVHALGKIPRVKGWAHTKFKYILIDEIQDTNFGQYRLIKELLSPVSYLWACGDLDQGIYGWRGADIQNILNFQADFPGTKLIKLEQNYRSTKTIVEAADAVVANNKTRLPKTCYSKNSVGMPIKLLNCNNEHHEAEIISLIATQLNQIENITLDDMAVLYRTNMQYRAIEDVFLQNKLKYTVVGGTAFYQRMEIKDLLGFLQILANPIDSVAFKRVATLWPGVGEKTVNSIIAQFSDDLIAASVDIPKIKKMYEFLSGMQSFAAMHGPHDILVKIVADFKYEDYLIAKNKESAESRFENVKQLLELSKGYTMISNFLSQAALASITDKSGTGIKLMTVHGAKGLEFKVVFLAGMEEDLFPMAHGRGDIKTMEEERRLAYVAMTRAEKYLYITYANERIIFGKRVSSSPSCFLKEIPKQYLQGDIPN